MSGTIDLVDYDWSNLTDWLALMTKNGYYITLCAEDNILHIGYAPLDDEF